MPGAGGTQRLLRSVGKPVASLMLMCGEALTGERAYQLGLVSELAEEGQALNQGTGTGAQGNPDATQGHACDQALPQAGQ